jgi:phosphatidylglycerol lysyltransferase
MPDTPDPSSRITRAARAVLPWVGPVALGAALWLLYREFRGLQPHLALRALLDMPNGKILASLLFTGAGYLLLTTYDLLAFRYVGLATPFHRILPAAFTAYAFSNSAGNTLLTGTPIRVRLYSALGVDAPDVTRILAFDYLTFWIGVFVTGGAVLVAAAPPLPSGFPLPFETARIPGAILLGCGLLYIASVSVRRRTLRVRGWSFPFPGPRMTLAQILVANLDWIAAALALWVLLPEAARLPFPAFLGVFLAAQILGLASQVPGGLGVFETVVGLALPESASDSAVVGALLVYRIVYYLLPLTAAAVFLAVGEFRRRRDTIERVGRTLEDWISEIFPQLLAVLVLVAGSILLFTGSLPGAVTQSRWLGRGAPLSFVEASHFLGSLLGMALVLLARGLQRRADAAWTAAVVLLGATTLLTLLEGQWFHATFLGLLLVLTLPCRREFYRRTTLTRVMWSPGWMALVLTVLLGTVALAFFSYRRLDYSNELWWRFALDADAPRSMRAAVGAVALAGAFALARLFRATSPPPAEPVAEEIELAATIAATRPDTIANLALLGDKHLLFGADRNSFLMYGVDRRAWISMGDPQGTEGERADLAWRFREMVDRHGGIPAFYEVQPANLGLYVDLGLGIHNIGECARVPLHEFSLEGPARKGIRQTVRRHEEREGCTFDVIAPADLPAVLPRLRVISDEWLASKNSREKRFSLGCFREDYLLRQPIGVVRKGEEIVAFANLWRGGGKEELSIDLMRYASSAPSATMEYLFTKLMLWGRDEGYAWFHLGMAPLSGLERHDLAPMHHRVGDLIFRHGEHFYHFRGLKDYKDKFDPVWEPRYVACPSFALPRILLGVASLIGGGIEGVIRR